jgi:hypothetical protein
MCKTAVFTEFALAFFLPKLAELGFEVVVWDVHHSHHQLSWKRFISSPKFMSAVSEVAARCFRTMARFKMIAQLCFVQIGQIH